MVSHGRLDCTRCWSNYSDTMQECGPFRLVRDPGHWGASDPHTLVLGISKGNTQSKALVNEAFENVAFKGIRHRMLEAFHAVGLLPNESTAQFDNRFAGSERDFAFASVVRCSLTGVDRKKGIHTADSPNVLPAFKYGRTGNKFVESCVDQYLINLGQRTQIILLLGNTDAYVSALRNIIIRRRGSVSLINPVAYISNGVRFVHIAHPSKGNGHFGKFLRGEGVSGTKRDWARAALDI